MLALFYVPSPPIPVCISPVLSLPLFIICICPPSPSSSVRIHAFPAACFVTLVLPKTCSTPLPNWLRCITHSKYGSLHQLRQSINSHNAINFIISVADQSDSIDRTPDHARFGTRQFRLSIHRDLPMQQSLAQTSVENYSCHRSIHKSLQVSSVSNFIGCRSSLLRLLGTQLLSLLVVFSSSFLPSIPCVNPQPSTRLDDPAPPLPSP